MCTIVHFLIFVKERFFLCLLLLDLPVSKDGLIVHLVSEVLVVLVESRSISHGFSNCPGIYLPLVSALVRMFLEQIVVWNEGR